MQHCPPELGNPLSELHRAMQQHAEHSHKKNREMKRSNGRINKGLPLTVIASIIVLRNALSVGCSSDDGLLLSFFFFPMWQHFILSTLSL